MITLYLRDAQDIFTQAEQWDPMGPVPPRAVSVAPPMLASTEVARWIGAEWEVLEERPAPSTPALEVPPSVTRRQARQALLLAGLLDSVPIAIAAVPDETHRRMAQIEWEDSQVFERYRPLVVSIGGALGLSSSGLDDLFIQAASL